MKNNLTALATATLFLSITPPPQYIAPKTAEEPPKTLKMMFVGDIMSQLPQIEAAHEGNGIYNYTPCFQYVKPIFKTVDLTIGNLECTLRDAPPYTGYPNFKSPNQLAEALKINGLDILMTANNHALDGGLDGLVHTLDVLKKNKFLHTGTFRNAQERKALYPLIFYKNGFKIAILNATHHINGYPQKPPSIVNKLDMTEMKADFEAAKKQKPDFTIAFVHWGDEHHTEEQTGQRGVAQELYKMGADLVVGAHPHVVQPIKMEKMTMPNGKTRNGLVAYSLGNFVSAQPFVNTEGGIIFELEIEKTATGVQYKNYTFIPVYRYQDTHNKYFIVPISVYEGQNKLGMSAKEWARMNNFAAKFRPHLERFGIKEHYF